MISYFAADWRSALGWLTIGYVCCTVAGCAFLIYQNFPKLMGGGEGGEGGADGALGDGVLAGVDGGPSPDCAVPQRVVRRDSATIGSQKSE